MKSKSNQFLKTVHKVEGLTIKVDQIVGTGYMP
jgi:hypothetical protein